MTKLRYKKREKNIVKMPNNLKILERPQLSTDKNKAEIRYKTERHAELKIVQRNYLKEMKNNKNDI